MANRPSHEALVPGGIRAACVGTPAVLSGIVLASLLLAGGSCPPPPAELLHGKELVGRVTQNSASIRLVAGDACTPCTRFRLLHDVTSRHDPSAYAFQTAAVAGFAENSPIEFELQSLPANTRIYYRVAVDQGGGWAYRDEYSFHTRRSPGEPFRFCLVADTHASPPRPLHRVAYANVLADNPDLLILLGDEVGLGPPTAPPYFWEPKDRMIVVDTYKGFRGIADLACHSMSCLLVNGNHEGLFGWTTYTPQYEYIREAKHVFFPVPDGVTFPEGGDDDGRYGAFTWGDVLFVWLDVVGFCPTYPREGPEPNYVLGDVQKNFLETTLANSSARWKFVFAHHLFGGNEGCLPANYGRGNANGANRYDQAEIQSLMVEHGAQAFFYGHDHVFSVSEAGGVSYICSGNPGAGTWGSDWLAAQRACYEPYILFPTEGSGVPTGHVRVDVSHEEVTVSYVRASEESNNRTVIASHALTP